MTNGEPLLNINHSTMGAGCLGVHSRIVWHLAEMKRPPQRTGAAAKILPRVRGIALPMDLNWFRGGFIHG